MRYVLLLFCLIVVSLPARAADPAGTLAEPNANSTPLQGSGAAPAAGAGAASNARQVQAQNCPTRPLLAQGAPSSIIVELDPNTLWRPRGAEVRFTIRGASGPVEVAKVRVCFGWGSSDGEFWKNQVLLGSPQVRSISNDSGVVEYGAVVPVLPRLPDSDWWPRRIFSPGPYIFTGAFTVPVADMVVEVTTSSGSVPMVVTATQVGITAAPVAWVVVVVVGALVWLTLDRIAKYRHIRGRNLLLRVISTSDGYASLSQLQIVLWTVVVGMSAIYVMTLSGNLISISEGTLVLLGIASAAGLAARIPISGLPVPMAVSPAAPVTSVAPVVSAVPAPLVPAVLLAPAARASAVAPVPPAEPVMPEWSDLLIPDRSSGEIDVTRLQMLAFTLITAGFVLIKVVVDYEIPSIPSNFLILMGISNSVYVGGQRLPSQPKTRGAGPEA